MVEGRMVNERFEKENSLDDRKAGTADFTSRTEEESEITDRQAEQTFLENQVSTA